MKKKKRKADEGVKYFLLADQKRLIHWQWVVYLNLKVPK